MDRWPLGNPDAEDGDAVAEFGARLVQRRGRHTHGLGAQPQVRQCGPVLTVTAGDHRPIGIAESHAEIDRKRADQRRRDDRIVVMHVVGRRRAQAHGQPRRIDADARGIGPHHGETDHRRRIGPSVFLLQGEQAAGPIAVARPGRERGAAVQDHSVAVEPAVDGRAGPGRETDPFALPHDVFQHASPRGAELSAHEVKDAQMVPHAPRGRGARAGNGFEFARHLADARLHPADVARGRGADQVGLLDGGDHLGSNAARPVGLGRLRGDSGQDRRAQQVVVRLKKFVDCVHGVTPQSCPRYRN